MTILSALRRNMGIRERRERFPKLREALTGADAELIQQVQALDTLDQGALDRYSGPALRELAQMQGEAAAVQLDAMWNALAVEVSRMKERKGGIRDED